MKNVRLFAVAAAIGMFATTVSAAELAPVYKTTWAGQPTGSVIKVDVNNNVVAPALTATVTKTAVSDTKTTGATAGTVTNGVFAAASDLNADGRSDVPFFRATQVDDAGFWFFTDAKFYPSINTSQYYLGMAKNEAGGRIVLPGQAAKDGWVDGLNHTFFPNTAEGRQLLIDKLVKTGAVVVTTVSGKVAYELGTATPTKNYGVASDNSLVTKNASITKKYFAAAKSDARSDADKIADAQLSLLNYIAGTDYTYAVNVVTTSQNYFNAAQGVKIVTTAGSENYARTFTKFTAATSADVIGVQYVKYEDRANATETLTAVKSIYNAATPNDITYYYMAEDGRNGSYLKEATLTFANATAADTWLGTMDLTKATYNALIINSTKVATNTDTVYSYDYSFFTAVEKENVPVYQYKWDAEKLTFVKADVYSSSVASDIVGTLTNVSELNNRLDTFGGFYRVNLPANTSTKYLVSYDLGAYPAQKLAVSYSTAKDKLIFNEVPTNYDAVTTYETSYVDFGTRSSANRVPAFDTKEEAVKFMAVMAGVKLADDAYVTAELKGLAATKPSSLTDKSLWKVSEVTEGTFGSWYAAWDHQTTKADGTKEYYVPKNAYDHTKASTLVFAGASSEVTGVTITNNAATIDTKTAGVKDLVYTAKVGETVVGTETVKVVVAPKYERTWVGGKVATLKAYHLNGNLYANYSYDYAKKVVTVTFYEFDGVTVNSTAELPL